MKIEIDENDGLILSKVYSGVTLKTDKGEKFGICMRDGGFEFQYNGIWYSAVNGELKQMSK